MGKLQRILSQIVFSVVILKLSSADGKSYDQDLDGFRRAQQNGVNIPWTQPIPREQWESWVTNGDVGRQGFLRSSRFPELQNFHAKLTFENRRKALDISRRLVKSGAPDLDGLRRIKNPDQRDTAIERMCAVLPKGALLHVHPNGTIGAQYAIDLLKEYGEPVAVREIWAKDQRLLNLGLTEGEIQLFQGLFPLDLKPLAEWPERDVLLLRRLMTLPQGAQPFSRFDAVFPFVKLASRNTLMRMRVYLDHAKRAQKEGIQYIEYTTSIKVDLKTQRVADPREVDLLVQIAEHVHKNTQVVDSAGNVVVPGVVVRFNISFLRTEPAQDLKIKADAILRFLKESPQIQPYFVGIDLLGPEHKDSALDKGLPVYSTFVAEELAGGLKLKRTQHAGEHGHLMNPRDAMIMGAHRLGHGPQLWYRRGRDVYAAESFLAMEYARRRQILIETNLTSNVRLKSVGSFSEQPWLISLRLGIPVALSTDNDGILNTSPAKECEIAVKESDITYWELKQMSYNSLKHSFAPEALKTEMERRLDQQFERFEGSQLWR